MGSGGNNGFYMAVVKENKAREATMTLSINLERMLPAQSWAPVLDYSMPAHPCDAAVAAAESIV